MLSTIIKSITPALVFLFFGNTAHAQCSGVCTPNLNEEFNYAANTALYNAVGGSGWAGGWDVQNGITTVPGYSISSGSLSSGSIKAFNNRLSGGLSFLTIGRALNTSNSTNAPFAGFIDSAGLIGLKGTTLYYSVLLRKNGNNTQQVRAMLHKGNTVWNVSNSGSVGIGYFGTASETSGTKFWSLQVEGTTTKTSVPVTIGTTALLVLKMEFLNGSTKYSLYVNPVTIGSGGEPATPALTQTINKMMDFKAMAIRLGDASAQGDIDEIRMATTYQCATPDAGTAFNLLPVASFSNNISSGTAPFSVSFNGNASSDPDGTIASYSWSFSDGNTATGATPTVLFKNQGAIIATLTVTDNCGSTGSASTTILVNNSKGYFSCFSTPRLSKFGNCDSTSGGGEIILSGGTSYSVFNKKTSATTNQSSGIFSNLNAGFYRFTTAGDLGCKDTFNLQVPISHECAGQAKANLMKMGINVENLDYFTQCATFKDYMRSSGDFFTFNASGSSAFNTNLINLIPVDTNGYPLQVPFTPAGNVAQKIRKMLSSTVKHLPLGNYVLLYDGTGTFNINGATLISNAANRIVYTVTGTGNVWLEILSSSSSDHVRNIRFVQLADEAGFAAQPFADKFLRALCNFSCMRFMQMQCTIDNANRLWSGRTIPTFHSQSGLATANKGIAYEHICQMANITGKDIWICVPHLVDDNYITEMAKLFKANLNPGIKVFLEFSNEVWNFGYTETMDVYNAGPQNITNARRYALRSANMFNLWKQVWGNDFNRIIRVLGTQAVNNTNAQEAMAELQDNFDVLSPALYFNYTKDATCYANLKSLGTAATAHDILNCAKNDFLTSWTSVAQNNKDAWMYGKGIVHYEWGQGLTSDGKIETFQDSTYAAQISAEMAQLYQQALDSMKHWNTDQINPYALTGERQSKYGSWGHLEYIDQDTTVEPAPKYSTLLKNINTGVQGICLYPGIPITASAGNGGSISPSGTVTVGNGGSQTFAITANTGFCIQNVVVDGTSVGAVSSFGFTNITATHSISVSFIAEVTPAVTISINANNICANTGVVITATPTNGGTAPNYNFKVNRVSKQNGSSAVFTSFTLSDKDTVTCTITRADICTNNSGISNNIIMSIKRTPPAPVFTSGVVLNCTIGEATPLYADTWNGIWTSSNPAVASVSTTGASGKNSTFITAVANGSTTISYTIMNSTTGCSSAVSTVYSVAAVNTPIITGASSVCVYANTTLNATPVGGVWSTNNNRASVVAGLVTGQNIGTGSITYKFTIGACSATATHSIIVQPLPSVPNVNVIPAIVSQNAICNGKTYQFFGTPSGGLWATTASAGVATLSSGGQLITVGSGFATLSYTITNLNGCSNSRSFAGQVISCLAKETNPIASSNYLSFTLYPNPAKGIVSLKVDKLISEGTIMITDIYGKELYTSIINSPSTKVDISHLIRGMYLVNMITNKGKTTKKLIVE